MPKSKNASQMDCSAPGEEIIRQVLQKQVKALCAKREKALDFDDIEGVHQMRVISRRLRSAIADFKPYLRKSSLPALKLKAIAQSLGAVRDEDVVLVALAELKSKASGPAADAIELMAEERRARRKDARAALKRAIKHSAVAEFRKEFLDKLNAIELVRSKQAGGASDDSHPTFRQIGTQIINDRLKDFRAASPHIYNPFEIKELHELRILAKRLRYAIELFAPCWGKELAEIAKEISYLQDSLGELHDCDVWIENLSARLKPKKRKSPTDSDEEREREGSSWLLEHFTKERTRHYLDALARWKQWQADEFLENLIVRLHG